MYCTRILYSVYCIVRVISMCKISASSVVINLYLKGKLPGKCAIERESKSVGIRVENAGGRRNPPVRTALSRLLTFPGETPTSATIAAAPAITRYLNIK